MSNAEVRLGLTPVLKRLAYSYLCRGVGVYHNYALHPPYQAHYDRVVVSEIYPWQPNPENPDECAGGLRVAFYKGEERLRYVEFNVRCVGGGGKEVIRRV